MAVPPDHSQITGIQINQLKYIEIAWVSIAVTDLVMAVTAAEAIEIVAFSTFKPVIASAPNQGVAAGFSVQPIIASSALQQIITSTAEEGIMAIASPPHPDYGRRWRWAE